MPGCATAWYGPPAAWCAHPPEWPSLRSSRTGRLRLVRTPAERRCRAHWSAARVADRPSSSNKCRNALIGPLIAQHHEIGMHLLGRASLLARFTRFHAQPVGELLRKSSLLGRSGTLNFGSTVLARRFLRMVLRDNPVRRSISRIGIPSPKCQRRITLSNAMSITPVLPDQQPGNDQNMGQISVKTCAPRGSDLRSNQQPPAPSITSGASSATDSMRSHQPNAPTTSPPRAMTLTDRKML